MSEIVNTLYVVLDAPTVDANNRRILAPQNEIKQLKPFVILVLERLRFAFTAYGKRQTSVENFSE